MCMKCNCIFGIVIGLHPDTSIPTSFSLIQQDTAHLFFFPPHLTYIPGHSSEHILACAHSEHSIIPLFGCHTAGPAPPSWWSSAGCLCQLQVASSVYAPGLPPRPHCLLIMQPPGRCDASIPGGCRTSDKSL